MTRVAGSERGKSQTACGAEASSCCERRGLRPVSHRHFVKRRVLMKLWRRRRDSPNSTTAGALDSATGMVHRALQLLQTAATAGTSGYTARPGEAKRGCTHQPQARCAREPVPLGAGGDAPVWHSGTSMSESGCPHMSARAGSVGKVCPHPRRRCCAPHSGTPSAQGGGVGSGAPGRGGWGGSVSHKWSDMS